MNALEREKVWLKEIKIEFSKQFQDELVRQMEIELMWGTKLPIYHREFKPTLYQTHKKYLITVLKLSGL